MACVKQKPNSLSLIDTENWVITTTPNSPIIYNQKGIII